MKKIFLIFLSLSIIVIVSCSTEKSKLEKISLRQEWIPNASYFGEVVAINETDSLNGIDLSLIAGSYDIDPIKMVLSGTDLFGVCGADRILTANEKGADLVAIGTINYINPTCFLAKAEKRIMKPKDFEDRKIGVFTGNNTEMIYRILMSRQKVDMKRVTEIEAPFDLGSFIIDAYDVRPAYIFDEPVSLDMQNIKYTIVDPADYGISFVGMVYFCKRSTIQNSPKLVQAFINTIVEGWDIALKDPQKAVNYLKKYDSTIDTKRETLSFKKGFKYFEGENGKLLVNNIERWRQMAEYLVELKQIKKFDIAKSVDNTFIDNYYSQK